jgi:hypothetical protein
LLALLGTEDTKFAANLLLRYSAANRRTFTAAFRTLKELQGDRFNRPPAIQGPQPRQHQQHSSEATDNPISTSSVATDGESEIPDATEACAQNCTTPEATATAAVAHPRRFAPRSPFAAHIVAIRRHHHREMRQSAQVENRKLRNEPERALAAGQSLNIGSLLAA